MYRTVLDSVGEGEGGMIWENGIETCIISCMKWVASPGSMHDNFILFLNFTILYWFCQMNPPQVYMCSPSWTLLPPPSSYHPSGSSQCTSPKHPVSCIEPGLETHFIHDSIHVSMPFSQIFPPSPSPTESIRRMLPLLPKKYNPSLEFVSRISVIQILELCDL